MRSLFSSLWWRKTIFDTVWCNKNDMLNDMSWKQVTNISGENPLAFNLLSKKPLHQNINYPVHELSAWLGKTCIGFLSPAISWIMFLLFRSHGGVIYSSFVKMKTWTRSRCLVSQIDCVTALPFWGRFWQISKMILIGVRWRRLSGSVHTWCPGTVPGYDSKLSTNVNTPFYKYPMPKFRLSAIFMCHISHNRHIKFSFSWYQFTWNLQEMMVEGYTVWHRSGIQK